MEVKRELLPDGQVRLTSSDCTFVFKRLRPGAMLVTIKGHDKGQFGTTALDEVRMELMRQSPIELFVDAHETTGAAGSVSDDWTQFFAKHHAQLKRVHVLVGSKIIALTVSIAKHLSRTGHLIQIHSDRAKFDALVTGAASAR